MKRSGLAHGICFVLLAAALLLPARSLTAQSVLDPASPKLTLCQDPYALCAAATCKLTGYTIRDNNGTSYPEVVCECPVFSGPALAELTGGNMQGSCLPPVDPVTGKTGVWSLFWPNLDIPQEIHGVWHENVLALPHNCPSTIGKPAQPVLFGQCFSYSCKNVRTTNGVLVADCYCPAQQILDPNKNEFAVQAGQCQTSVCTQIPVGAPFVAPGNLCR
jgi:hypothetical protein